MTEQYTRYLFVSRVIEEMQQQLHLIKQQKKARPMDIWLNSAARNIAADIVMLRQIEVEIGLPLFADLESKHNIKFSFLRPQEAKSGIEVPFHKDDGEREDVPQQEGGDVRTEASAAQVGNESERSSPGHQGAG